MKGQAVLPFALRLRRVACACACGAWFYRALTSRRLYLPGHGRRA